MTADKTPCQTCGYDEDNHRKEAHLYRSMTADNEELTDKTSPEALLIAGYLLTHVGGDETDPWQAGHNYAMREAARLVREGNHLLDYGKHMPCPGCGNEPPHTEHFHGTRVECGVEGGGCGDSWGIDQRGYFKWIYDQACEATR